jgi:holo-[acyl-carrier protein] synthase
MRCDLRTESTVDDNDTEFTDQPRPDEAGPEMEIIGIGSEIVECLRIGKMIELHGELFLRRVYTEPEIRFCQSRRHATEHFAGLWAAKEAVIRAIGMTLGRETIWTDLEIQNLRGGRSLVKVCGAAKEIAREREVADVLLSISHCRTYATAYALAIGRPKHSGPAAPETPVPNPDDQDRET